MSRRMFSTDIIENDLFLEMPSSSRLLYYDLGVRADMDGFITPLKVFRMTGANPDDLKLLILKGFVYQFEDGVIVIRHWLVNNKINGDKYTQSAYYDRLSALKEQGIYAEKLVSGRPKKTDLLCNSTKEPLKDSPGGEQYRIGKVRSGQDSLGQDNHTLEPQSDSTVGQTLWKSEVGTVLRAKLNENEKAYGRLLSIMPETRLIELLHVVRYARADRYAGKDLHVIGNYLQLEKNLEKIEAYEQGKRESIFVEKKKVGKYVPSVE